MRKKKKQSLVEMWEEEKEPGGITWSLEPLNPVVEATGFHEPNNVQFRVCSLSWFSILYTQKCPEWYREFLPFSHSFTHSTKNERHCPNLEGWAETAVIIQTGPESWSPDGVMRPPRRNWGFQGMCQGGPPPVGNVGTLPQKWPRNDHSSWTLRYCFRGFLFWVLKSSRIPAPLGEINIVTHVSGGKPLLPPVQR